MKKFIIILTIYMSYTCIFSQGRFTNLDVFNIQYARDPQLSPDNSQIVYVRTKMDIMKDGKTSSLWIINKNGDNHQKLTSNLKNESNPRWSPDAKRIAFISSNDDSNGSEIYIYWIDTKQYSAISQLNKSPKNLKWSPNGK